MMRAGVSSGAVVMARVEDDGPEQNCGRQYGNPRVAHSRTWFSAGGCLICETRSGRSEWYADTAFHGEHPIGRKVRATSSGV